eukprot:TRINITY_DN24774_c0_g1_i1.p1 TRINITY_DN24774_c0_g1~~TRINITY_DN24774_c0_g1_i1.p1  ORF type:complete len:193 (+),score=33.73 TRINITY_DN24774_c0_g1_i1:60-581(+)
MCIRDSLESLQTLFYLRYLNVNYPQMIIGLFEQTQSVDLEFIPSITSAIGVQDNSHIRKLTATKGLAWYGLGRSQVSYELWKNIEKPTTTIVVNTILLFAIVILSKVFKTGKASNLIESALKRMKYSFILRPLHVGLLKLSFAAFLQLTHIQLKDVKMVFSNIATDFDIAGIM